MLGISIERDLGIPFNRQIYTQLREKILSGDLSEGTCLPASRRLAEELKVSRNVVLDVYEQLTAEGYLEARQGAGTYVAEGIRFQITLAGQALEDKATVPADTLRSDVIDFRTGVPEVGLFPRKIWAKLAHEVSLSISDEALGYGHPAGSFSLRQALSRYLFRMRGVVCQPENLLITSGATQAFSLIANLLIPAAGGKIVMEDPVTAGIQSIFQSTGASLHPVPVDHSGMRTDLLPNHVRPDLVLVTPSHQFPTGTILPVQRRIQLIHYIRQMDSYLIEDDYDSEFRYKGSPIHALQGLDPERVIYVGTFSKTLSPGLRLGFIVLPKPLIERFQKQKWLTDHHCASIEQLILAQFIERGYLEKHVFRMKKLYKSRRQALIAALQTHFQDSITISGDATGLHLLVRFEQFSFSQELLERIEQGGVRVYPVEQHAIVKGHHEQEILFGYGNLTPEQCGEGVRRLYAVLSEEQRETSD